MIQNFGKLAERLGMVQNREQIGECLFDFIEQSVDIPYFNIFLYDFTESRLVSVCCKGFTREQQLQGEQTVMDRHPGTAFKTVQIVDIPDVHNPADVVFVSSPRDFSPNSSLAIPICSDDKPLGVLTMASEVQGYFTQQHKDVILSACNVAGIAYRNMLRIQEQKKLLRQLLDAKKEAEIANDEKSLFLANVSHELRTPIHGIQGLIDLSHQTVDEIQKESYLRFMSQTLGQLQSVVEDLLDVSTIQSGRFVIRNSWFRLQDVIPGLVAEFSGLAQKKGLGFVPEMDDAPYVEVQADSSRLRQVLSVILSNAIKYTKTGAITFGADCSITGDIKQLHFSISDTGLGISDQDLPYIFEPFYRSSDEEKRAEKGTGLGLAVCKQILEQLGGSIEVTTKIGEGSCFDLLFQLPCRPTQNAAIPEPKTSSELHGKTVLVAEDSEVNQMVLSNILEQFGMEVLISSNGEEAWQITRQKRVDLLILDLQMPIMTGQEAIRAIRADGVNTPAIALTANSDKLEEQDCLASGFQQYVSKPFNTSSMQRLMADLMDDHTVNV